MTFASPISLPHAKYSNEIFNDSFVPPFFVGAYLVSVAVLYNIISDESIIFCKDISSFASAHTVKTR